MAKSKPDQDGGDYPSPEQAAALADTVALEKPEPVEIARGVVVELRGASPADPLGQTHVVIRVPTQPAEMVHEIAPGQEVAIGTAVAIFDDGSVALVGKPPQEPPAIELPTGAAHG